MLGHIGILYILIATKCIILGGQDVPIRVNGLINRSIFLSLPGDPSLPIQQVIWNHGTDTRMIYTDNQLTVIEDQYKGRLEILDDGRVLRIGQLRLEDSGKYTATITFINTTKHKKVYNLSVYEPVPAPIIEIEERKNTSDWCTVTLRCSVPTNTSPLSYIWKYRHRGSDYQLYNNNSGEKIIISLQPKSWETEVFCIVHNPADSNNVSLYMFCPDYSENSAKGNPEYRRHSYYVLVVLVVLVIVLLALGWYFNVKRKRRKELEHHILKHQSA